MNNSRLTYQKPVERYEKIPNSIIDKFEPAVIGVYCKMIRLSSGKSLSIDWMVKKMGVSKERVRKIIIFLEEQGYIVRKPIRDNKGHISSWNYVVFAEPVRKADRSHAGKKENEPKAQPIENPTYGKPTTLESDGLIISNNIIYNNEDNNSSINTPVKDDKEKDAYASKSTRTEEELSYEKKMKEQFPRIMRMEQPLTLEQAKNLKKRYDSDLLMKIMQDMENWKPLIKKNVSAYKTIINWCDRENERS